MLYREIIAVCSQIHTQNINTLCGQNVELLNVKLAVYKQNTALYMVKHGSLLGAFAKLRKITINFAMSVRLSVQLGSQ